MKALVLLLTILCVLGCASPPKNRVEKPSRFSEIIKKSPGSGKYCPQVADGEICLMAWPQALEFCKTQHAHLPTAREYANRIKPLGTQVLEVTNTPPPPDFYLVDCKNPDGRTDKFYMNHSGYKRPQGESGSHLLWTASIPPEHPQYAHVYYDQWGGGGGNPKDHLLNHPNAVQCVADQ